MLTQIIVWLNLVATQIARVALAPIAWLPGWLSLGLISVMTGVAMLWVFKHTSNQPAIKATRNQIKANLLSLSLFKDSLAVSLRAQGRIVLNSLRLMRFALVPLLVMTLPMTLLLVQLAVWYQARPLPVGGETIITARFGANDDDPTTQAMLQGSPAFDLRAGPVRIKGQQMVCWRIQAKQPGVHELTIAVQDQQFTKELAVGESFLPVSQVRPGWNWFDALLNPRERPFPRESAVQAIEVAYPDRVSWTSGTDWWVWYWFGVSLAAAFAVRPLLGVSL